MPPCHARFALVACLLGTAGLTLPVAGADPATSPQPVVVGGSFPAMTDEYIRGILKQRIDKERRAVGIVVGIVTDKGTRIISYGRAKGDGPTSPGYQGDEAALTRPLDGDTVFEIGSITKTFTATLLADMARKDEVSVDDPVAKYLPADANVPSKDDQAITLRLLAQHLSGLPRMPDNFRPKDLMNPYADYDAARLQDFLLGHTLRRDPGESVEYSNLGYGLLGHALALKAGQSYEDLVRERITGPLGMSDTVITLTPSIKARLAQGHDDRLEAAANWDLGAVGGAGAIRSTVNDMLKYCAANAGIADSPLRETFAVAQELKHPRGRGDTPGSLAWSAPQQRGGRQIWWHNGGTGGYHSFMGFDHEAKLGVVVLSNCVSDIDDIGMHLLVRTSPVDVKRTAITLPREALEKVVGVYEVGPGSYRTVTRYRDRLFMQRTRQMRREYLAEAPNAFFNSELKSTLAFTASDSGAITGLVVRGPSGESPSERVDRAPEGKALVEQDPAAYDGCVGTYSESPDFVLTVRRDGERLMIAVTGQGEFELFPLGEDRFTILPVDCEFQFERGADGQATGVTRYQNGAEVKSKRVK